MLFWLMIIVAAFLIFLGVWKDMDLMKFAATLSCMILAFMAIVLIVNRSTESGIIALNEKRYEALTYKAETESLRDEFGIVNKEYLDEIQEWNEDLAEGKVMQDNFWIGIFYPHVYDVFDYIDLESIEIKD